MNRKFTDPLQVVVGNYQQVEEELYGNQATNITFERRAWLLERAETLSARIDQLTNKYFNEMIAGTGAVPFGNMAH